MIFLRSSSVRDSAGRNWVLAGCVVLCGSAVFVLVFTLTVALEAKRPPPFPLLQGLCQHYTNNYSANQ